MQAALTMCKNGLKSSLHIIIKMSKLVIPVYFGIKLLETSGILVMIAEWLSPAMAVFGLPGEAALLLVLGNCINLYSVMGGMAAMALTAKQATIIAGMLLVSHSLIMEAVVIRQSGASPWGTLVLRFAISIVFGIFLNWVL